MNMRTHTLFLPLLLLLGLPLSAEGINFSSSSFTELLETARATGKIVFIDAYATWCGPCKVMDRDVFTDDEVGAYYNEHFVNARIDMEDGEGLSIAELYEVEAYPTYLFLDADGTVVHRATGSMEPQEFIDLGREAGSSESLADMTVRFEAGETDRNFLLDYARKLAEAEREEEADAALGRIGDWAGEDVYRFLLDHPGKLGSKRSDYLIEHAAAIGRATSTSETLLTIQANFLERYAEQEEAIESLPEPREMLSLYADYGGELAAQLRDHYQLLFYQINEEYANYISEAASYYEAYPTNDSEVLDKLAWTVFKTTEDEATLRQGLAWAEQSVALEVGYSNLDTLAWLHHKLGNREKAYQLACDAVIEAVKRDEDFSNTVPLIRGE